MQTEILYLQLKSHRLFQGLPKEDIYRVLDQITLKRKRKGEHFNPQSDQSQTVYFILKGKVKIQQVNEEGTEVTKRIIKDGDFFGTIIDQNDTNDYATVITDEFVYFSMALKRFEGLSLEIPQLSINLSRALAHKLNVMENRYASLVSDDVQTRLIDFFSNWADEEGKQQEGEVELKNYLTHNDIANLISTCRQTVTSILNRLRTRGNIVYSRRKIVIPNLEQLRASN